MRKAIEKDELDDFGRFSEPALLILISLAEGPKHGYSMAEDIEAIAGLRLGPGTLYGATRSALRAAANRGSRRRGSSR